MDLAMIGTRHWVLLVFIASALYAHFRGAVRFGLVRTLTDFTVLLAPVNALMYLFSRTPRSVYIDQRGFPELAVLQQNWQLIRDEAMARLESMATHHALGRIGTTEEIAECVEYLSLADWTTGAVVSVDGGLSLGIITEQPKEN